MQRDIIVLGILQIVPFLHLSPLSKGWAASRCVAYSMLVADHAIDYLPDLVQSTSGSIRDDLGSHLTESVSREMPDYLAESQLHP